MATTHIKRRKRSKGAWMRLHNPTLLAQYMHDKDFSGARLGRYAGVSRQFIWQLVNDPTKRTCTPEVASRIEEAFGLLPGTLFVPPESPIERPLVKRRTTSRKVGARA